MQTMKNYDYDCLFGQAVYHRSSISQFACLGHESFLECSDICQLEEGMVRLCECPQRCRDKGGCPASVPLARTCYVFRPLQGSGPSSLLTDRQHPPPVASSSSNDFFNFIAPASTFVKRRWDISPTFSVVSISQVILGLCCRLSTLKTFRLTFFGLKDSERTLCASSPAKFGESK